MSFGFSIGDIVLVLKLAKNARKCFVDAPAQFRAISNEVKTLSNILVDLEDVVPERTLSKQLAESLKEHVTSCGALLVEAESMLGKYHRVDSTGTGVRRTWQRLKWEPADVKDLRARLASNVALLSSISDLLNRHSVSSIEKGVDKLNKLADSEELLRITNWLTTTDTTTEHSGLVARRHKDTGLWFLGSKQYLGWLESSGSTLFCPGMPGGGKTMIAASVIEDLWDKFETDPDVGVAFLYCSYKRQHEQTLENCLACLLKQLLQQSFELPIPPGLENMYRRHKIRKTRPSKDELVAELKYVLDSLDTTYFVIDALDEYSKEPGMLARFLDEIFHLQAQCNNVNVMVTSRPNIPRVRQLLEAKFEIEVSAREMDVRMVLESEMSGMPTCTARSTDLQALIIDEITTAVNGMFLLARLHLHSLRSKIRRKQVIEALKNIPRGDEALDLAYAEAIERIDGQQPTCRDLAKRVLSWISQARRPLTTMELQHAFAVEPGEPEIDQDNIPEVEDMVSCCEGLVVVDESSGIISLVHYTTQEYINRIGQKWIPFSHKDISLVSLAYLSFDDFATGSCKSDKEFEDRLSRNPLLDYCARNWGSHVREADDAEVEEAALAFLGDELRIASAAQVCMVSAHHCAGYSRNVPEGISAAHMAARFGLTKILSQLLSADTLVDPDPKDDFNRTPLSYAAQYGHHSIVELYAARQDVDFNSVDLHKCTPLSWAAAGGCLEVVKALLGRPGVDVNSKDHNLMSPLSWAAQRGHVETVRYLMGRCDVDTDSRDKTGQTPLSWAAHNRHLDVVKLLTSSPRVSVDAKDEFSQTPLSWAARNGHVAIVSYLLGIPGVSADSEDDGGRTALMWASVRGHLPVVKLLASRGARVDKTDQNGQSSLSWAAREGHLEIVEYLMSRDDVDVHTVDRRGFTARRWAAWNGYEAVVTALSSVKRQSLCSSVRVMDLGCSPERLPESIHS